MATRFYLPASGAAAVERAWSAYWNLVDDTNYHFRTPKTKSGTSQTDHAFSGYITYYNYGRIQFVSDQLAAYEFTPADELKMQVRVYNSSYATNSYINISLRVVSGDGATVRGILYEGAGPTYVPVNTGTNRSIGAAGAHVHIQNSVSMQAGDRLVLEYGMLYVASPSGTLHTYLGDNEANDLPENETSQDAYNAWWELSPTIADYGGGGLAIVKIINE